MIGTFWRLGRFAVRALAYRDAVGLQLARSLTWELDGRLRSYDTAGPLALPQVALQELVPDEALSVRVADMRSDDGGVSPYESFCLAAIARHVRPRCAFEIGTFRGQTTALLARHTEPEARIWTLDLPPAEVGHLTARPAEGDLKYIAKPRIGERFAGTPEGEKITQLLGDSMTFDFTPYHGRCDLVFVDGAHSYEFVRGDSETAFRLLAPGGVVLWHDYKPGCPGVLRALHEVAGSQPVRHVAGTSLAVYGLPRNDAVVD